MKLYNSLTKKIENFIPFNENEVTMYTCGPTVYHYAHIGNLRTYIFEDVLEKSLQYFGYNVKRVMNITDVGHLSSDADTGEDKMVAGAKRENKSVLEIADYYTKAFFNDTKKLNIRTPEIVEKATDHVDKYIVMVQDLLEKDIAYKAGGNIYFDITKYDKYYELSGKNVEDLKIAVRDDVEQDDNKKNPFDFVLWFTKSKFEDQDLKWESPFGMGYPGWHIECSAIALHYLGDHLDIHCGGVDNIFPHHTNEIAQTECHLGHKWCNFWLHGEHLNDETGKMSKSKGEFLTLSVLEEKGYPPLAYRFFCLKSHYRNQLVFNYDSMDYATNEYNKLKKKVLSLKNDNKEEIDFEKVMEYTKKYKESLADDLNTSKALTVLFDVLKDAQLNSTTKLTLIEDFDKVLSIDLTKEIEVDEELEKYIFEQIEKRNNAKKDKNYALADQIRDELLEKGIKLKDNKDNTTYEI